MAKNLHSTMMNGRGNTVSCTSNQTAKVMVETRDVRIVTVLNKDGEYTITISDRESGATLRVIDGKYPPIEK